MKLYSRIFIYGVLIWAIVFVAGFALFPFKQNGSPLFETGITIALVLCTVIFAHMFFKTIHNSYVKYGLNVGIIWALINIIIDQFFFTYGFLHMPLPVYFEDIGLTYVIIPIITCGMGLVLAAKNKGVHP
ncbi:MAG: hypothetical protein K1X44_06145 [Alphaproteobacteria bacterium]|nr:hypothetical protein [Alphaproteobacteria bacterium]